MFQETFQFADGFFDLVAVGQRNDAEVVGFDPVEARAVHQQYFFLHQKVVDEFHVVMDVVHFGVDFREHIHRAHRFDAGNTGDLGDQFVGFVALFEQAAAGQDQLVDALITAQGRLNRMLHRRGGAQAHGGEHVEAFDIALRVVLRAVEHHPALAESGHAVGFGEAVEGDGQQVGGEGGDVVVYRAVVEDFVVDFVGVDNQAVLACQLGDFEQDFFAVHRAGGVVGVDDDDGFGFGRDFGFHVGKVGKPAVFFVAQIMAYRAARQSGGSRPQRIVGRGNQDFVAVVQKCLHRHGNQLGYAVADVNVVYRDVAQAFGLVVVDDGLAGGVKAFGIAVALRGRQVADNVHQDFVGCFEAERGGVADVEFEDFVAFFFKLKGFFVYGAADVVTDVVELGGFAEFIHCCVP